MFSIENAANIVTIAVPIVGALVFGVRHVSKNRRLESNTKKMEDYLRHQRNLYMRGRISTYRHSVNHLATALRLSEEEIKQAARHSKKITHVPTQDAKGMATGANYEYGGADH